MYVTIFVVAMVLFIMFHEYGHFATARAFGMKAERFFLGFGPTLWSFQRGDTEYGVKAIPAGGFVKIAGMSPYEPYDEADRGKLFFEKAGWKRLVVLSAGSATHFVAAFLLLAAGLAFIGTPTGGETTTVVERAAPGGPGAEAGIEAGDEITSVAGTTVADTAEVRAALEQRAGETVAVGVVRDGAELELEVALPVGEERLGNPVYLDVAFAVTGGEPAVPMGVAGGLAEAAAGDVSVWRLTTLSVRGIIDVFSPQGLGAWFGSFGAEERTEDGPVSLVGAGQIASTLGQQGELFALLLILAQLNIVLGVMNMLPLPPLDGGHVLALAIESAVNGVRRLRGNTERWTLDPARLTPIALVVIAFFGTIFVASLYLDITNPASGLLQ